MYPCPLMLHPCTFRCSFGSRTCAMFVPNYKGSSVMYVPAVGILIPLMSCTLYSISHTCCCEASFTGSSHGELCLNHGNFPWMATYVKQSFVQVKLHSMDLSMVKKKRDSLGLGPHFG